MIRLWRKLKEKKKLFLIIGAVLLCVGAFLQYLGLTTQSIQYKPSYYYSANVDAKGNKYIISDGRAEFAVIDNSNTVHWTKNAANVSEFNECGAVVSDLSGNVYVHGMRWSSAGLSLDGEAVLKYSSLGKYEGELFSVAYDKNTVYKPQLFGLSAVENAVSFIQLENKYYKQFTASQGKPAELVKTGSLAHDIQDVAVYKDKMAYISKSGALYVCDDSQNEKLIFQPEAQSFVVPYKLVFSEQGEIFFTDIGNSDIYKANKSGASLLITRAEMDRNFGIPLEKEVLNSISISGNDILCVIFDHFFGTINLQTNSYNLEGAYSYNIINFILSLIKLIAFTVGAAFVVFGIFLSVKMLLQWFIGSKNRTTILLIGSISVTIALIMPGLLGQVRQSLVDAKENELTRIATSVAVSLKTEDLLALNYPADYNSESGKNTRNMISQMLPRIGSGSEIYCNLTKINNGRAYSFFYQDDSIGAFYPLRYEEELALRNLYETGETQLVDEVAAATGSFISVSVPVFDNGAVIGAVEVGMVLGIINGQLDAIMQSVLINTALIVLILIFMIQAIMSFYNDKKELKVLRSKNEKPFSVDSLRLCMLICSFAYNMSTAFLPVFMENLYNPSLPFGQYTAGALPLTMNIFLTGVAALLCTVITRKWGVRNSLLMGVACVFIGDLLTATAMSYWPAFSGIMLNGIGAGFVFAILFVVIAQAKPEEQGKGFSAYNGALMCGMICGTLAGASIAESFSQNKVFFCALVMWALLFLVIVFVGNRFTSAKIVVQPMKNKPKDFSFGKFLFSPSVFLFIILVQFPFAAADGFSYYFVPVFGAQQGLTEQEVSLLMVLNSLASVFIGDWLTQFFVGKYKNRSMYLATAILSVAIVIFAASPSITTLVIAILVIGIARSFGQPAQDTYICSLKATQRYGTQRGLGVYNFLQNVGNSTGTSIFGFITELAYSTGSGLLAGFGIFAAIGTGLAWLHGILFSKSNKKLK